MSSNESPLVPAELNGVSPLSPSRAVMAEAPPTVWALSSPAAGPGIGHYLHSFRRHWFIAMLLGLIAGAAAGVGTWFGYGAWYEASAYIRVATREDPVLSGLSRGYTELVTEYEIFKNTQQQLVKSRLVLTAALRKPDVAALRLDEREEDPVEWLADELIVRYPGRAEILEVALRSPDPEEARLLVQSVVDAYLDEVVNVEARRRRDRLNELDRVHGDKENEVRQVRTNLKALAEQLGTVDRETVTLKQQIAVQQHAEYQRQLFSVRFDLRKTTAELHAQQALLDAVSDDTISSLDVEMIAKGDPVYIQLANELAWRRMDRAYMQSHLVAGKKDHLSRYETDFHSIQGQVNEVYGMIREGLLAKKRAEIAEEIQKREGVLNGLIEFEQKLSAEVDAKKAEVDRLAGTSVDLDIMRSQIEQLEHVLKTVADERDRLRVEQRSPNRITPIQAAERPLAEHMPSVRYTLTALAGLTAFMIPVGLLVWVDSRALRVNSAEDVSRCTALSVVGSLPIIPGRVARRLARPSQRQRGWQSRLTEAVDGVIAHLLRVATADDARVVLVTSATSGEGKTTVATQLAMSLARNGRRAVLVDFSLRRPMLDRVFGLPEEPGVSEWLRGEAALGDIVHPTAVDDLAVVVAGAWDRQALAALAKGAASELFHQLRGQYDFVVIDGSPVLPVADTRFVSQHVDLALLTVFRDVSRLPKVKAAKDILEAFGAQRLETVVIGPSDFAGDRYAG